MATANPFDLLGDNDNDDPSLLIAAVQQKKITAKKPAASDKAASSEKTHAAAAKLPSKPLPPAQAVRESREARNTTTPARGGAGRGGPGRGRGGRGAGTGQNRYFGNGNADGFTGSYGAGAGAGGGGEDGDAGRLQERERPPRQPYSGGRYGGRGGYGNGEAGVDSERPPQRMYDRRSGTGRGNQMKRNGAGRGNWGAATEEPITQDEENVVADDKAIANKKQPVQEEVPSFDLSKENKEDETNEAEEKEEDKEMTLEEYEKIREEKRKALLAMKIEERRVEIDKELQSMQQLSSKKGNDDVFFKLGSDKDAAKKKETADRDEKSKKSVTISDFLKPAEGERYYSPAGRGRGRGHGDRGSFRGGYGGRVSNVTAAPSIEDPGQFPTLGGK